MKKKTLVVGGIAAAAVLLGGWALAQSGPHGRGGFGPPFMQGEDSGGMGPGMMQQMGRGMGPGMMQNMGPGMMGAGMGMREAGPMNGQCSTTKRLWARCALSMISSSTTTALSAR